MLSIPAIAGAGLFEFKDAVDAMPSLGPLVLATVVAAISGYLSIHWLLRFLARASLRSFAYYRLALGAVIIALLISHRVA